MTVEQILMPQLGESVTEGTITKWLIAPGDEVKKYEPVAEVLTDKVTAEVPSTVSGIVQEIFVAEGKTVPVGTALCSIATREAESPNIRTKKKPAPSSGNMKTRYSPVVLRLAREHDIDLTKVQGTGRGGRITRKDVLAFIEAQKKQPAKEQEVITAEREKKEPVRVPAPEKSTDIEIPVTPIRQTIAANMVRSVQEIPHAWMMVEVDVTGLVQYRDAVKDSFLAREGYPLTYFAFFVKACAQALKEFPMLNATWQGDKIIQKKEINLSIAVAAEDNLYVPVIKHADEKSIKGIAREIYELAERARNGTLRPEDVQGGTFTINNTGAFGSVQSMGIINYPQAAILQVETIVKRPVVIDGGLHIRDIVHLCLSIDHRVLDGYMSGQFLQRVKAILENMGADTTPIY